MTWGPHEIILLHDFIEKCNLDIIKLKFITPTHCILKTFWQINLHKLRVWYQRGIALLIAVQITNEFPQMR